jgi:hypothetical protein
VRYLCLCLCGGRYAQGASLGLGRETVADALAELGGSVAAAAAYLSRQGPQLAQALAADADEHMAGAGGSLLLQDRDGQGGTSVDY